MLKNSFKLEEKMKSSMCNSSFTLPKDMLLPEEIQTLFKQQIDNLKYERGILMKNVLKKDEQLKNLKGKISSIDFNNATDNNIGDYKNEINLLRNKISKLQLENDDLKSNFDSMKLRDLVIPKTTLEEIKQLKNKNIALNKKLTDAKNQLKLAKRILKQETGNDFDLKDYENSKWKGRAETISFLNSKVNDLQHKLNCINSNEIKEDDDQIMKSKILLEQARDEIDALNTKTSELQKKLTTKASWITTLENTVADLKSEIKSNLKKILAQESNIQLLQDQLEKCTEQNSIKMNREIKLLQNELDDLKTRLTKEQLKSENFESDLKERDNEIEKLKEFIEGKTEKQSIGIQCEDNLCLKIQKTIDDFQKELIRQEDIKNVINEKSRIPRSNLSSTPTLSRNVSRLSLRSNYTISNEIGDLQRNLQLSEERRKLLEAKLKCNEEETYQKLERLKDDIWQLWIKIVYCAFLVELSNCVSRKQLHNMVFTNDFYFPSDEELTVQEVNVSTSVFRAASFHLGKACEFESQEFMLCREELKDPRKCLDEGKLVTKCALDFFRKVKKSCRPEFESYAKCVDKSSGDFSLKPCRQTQKEFDKCALDNLNIERPHYGHFCRVKIHDSKRPKPVKPRTVYPDAVVELPDDYPRENIKYDAGKLFE